MSEIKHLLADALRPAIVWRALRVSAVIGTLLTLINHYDDWFHGATAEINLIQIGLTYLVPYLVSTHGQVYGHRNR
jgi:hypothetical protein